MVLVPLIWVAGSLNDINILWDQSSLLKSFLGGSFADRVDFEFKIGNRVFNRLWLMVDDGIYPDKLSRFVESIEKPLIAEHRLLQSGWKPQERY